MEQGIVLTGPSSIVFTGMSVDALRFLKRGASLLDAVVLIRLHNGATRLNGVRITPELAIALRGETNFTGAKATIDDQPVEIAWGDMDVLLLRTPNYDGSLPDLALGSYQGGVTVVSTNREGEAQLSFGHAFADAQHDVFVDAEPMGAPLFDPVWGVIGLQSRDPKAPRAYVPIADVVRKLEQSPLWDQIAAMHRLVRSVPLPTASQESKQEPDLARAVRWSSANEAKPMSERERRRAMGGKSFAELKLARGADPATTAEQRAIDRILEGGPYAPASIADEILLPFATAARWFRDVVPSLPDDETLAREINRRRQVNALVAIVGPRFAPRERESARLREWLANRDRKAMVVRGPGGIGKSALLAHFILENAKTIRFAWIDFDRPDVSADLASISRVVDQQLAWQAEAGPLVVVLDSFETAVQTYGYANLNPALDYLAVRFDDFAVVVGTRAPVPLLKLQGEPAEEWELPGLPIDVVTHWLVSEGIPVGLADDIAVVTNGVPLNMKLARDLLKGKSDAEAREIVASLPKELLTGYLSRRILRRLRDDRLKERAPWAMVPRRLVPQLLAAIFAMTSEDADRMFEALRSELTLLEGDTVLTLRPDLRNTLLPMLEAEDAARVREIDTIAADFWSQRTSDDVAATEAVYHALRIGDTTRAEQCWQGGMGLRLGAYAMEELPPASQVWLESRISREGADRATETMVAHGNVQGAGPESQQPAGVGTLSATKRRQRIQTLAAESNLDPAPAAPDKSILEAIVIGSTRPSIRVRGGLAAIDAAPWVHLQQQQEQLTRAIVAIGRIQAAGNCLGTATCIGPGLFVTTRGIVASFAVGIGHDVRLVDGRDPTIDMRAEGDSASDVHAITRVVLAHPYWDIAIVDVPTLRDHATIPLATTEPGVGIDVAVVGHPAQNPQEDDLVSRLFDGVYDVKRLMPGKYVRREYEMSGGRTVQAGLDDAATLSSDSGAAVVDPVSGDLLGVRFSWVFLANAKFVPAWELASDPAIAQAGATLNGAPQRAPQWTSAWSETVPARSTLLAAYVARTSGDVPRARALLELVADDHTVKIERTLLKAACELATDRLRAGDLLHELVTEVPREGWSNPDRDAAIATRLRLVVDAEAEREFLQVLHEQPMAAGLLDRRDFRVLAPPGGNLPWNRMSDRASSRVFGGDTKLPPEAVEIARRIVDASNRCLSLAGWIETYASDLANLSYLFNRPTADVREVAAAYVAYPIEQVRQVTEFLLDKSDLAPHPVKGWAPVAEPLFMMLRDAFGRLPAGVSSAKDLEAWLNVNAASGRLGSALNEFRFDSEVAWQAGLLHLTTDLPIERLLKRLYSGEKAA